MSGRVSFTPGPWTAEENYPGGWAVSMPPTEDYGSPGVEIISPNPEDDARLIAAAPDMFMALDQIEAWAEQIVPDDPKAPGYIALILERAKHALAGAEGRPYKTQQGGAK